MFDLPLHPAIVHVPIGLALLMPILAAASLAGWWRGAWTRRVWWLVLGTQLLVAGAAVFAVRTGEADEERVEEVVPEHAIEHHEEGGEAFQWVSLVLLAVMAGGLLPPERLARSVALAGVAGSVAAGGLALSVGHAGGQLVYRHGAAAVHVEGAVAASALDEHEHDHDEHDHDEHD